MIIILYSFEAIVIWRWIGIDCFLFISVYKKQVSAPWAAVAALFLQKEINNRTDAVDKWYQWHPKETVRTTRKTESQRYVSIHLATLSTVSNVHKNMSSYFNTCS